MTEPASRVSPAARALGFAGLLPQLVAAALVVTGIERFGGLLLAFIYAGLILSFLGGIWWGLAMHRREGQGALAAVAVVPALLPIGLGLSVLTTPLTLRWALVALGSAVMLTLLVDRALTRAGEAPAGWMGLRVPLSLGLGVLTIVAGAMP